MKRAAPLAEYLESCLGPTIAKQGFSGTDILVSWPEIAGERLAGYSQPIKVDWPRRANPNAPADPATLVVRVESAFALELQHLTSTAANVLPIPGTGRVIAIGEPDKIARLLDIAPALMPTQRNPVPQDWLDFVRSIADLPVGAEPNLEGMRAKARQLVGGAGRQEGGAA